MPEARAANPQDEQKTASGSLPASQAKQRQRYGCSTMASVKLTGRRRQAGRVASWISSFSPCGT